MNLFISLILFAQFTDPYETRVFLDSDGEFLIYARYFQDEFIDIDSIRSVADHFDIGLQKHNLNLLLEELKRDILQEGGYTSKGLFGTFEVPLPKGGFGDFMGETGKLDVGGYVKITTGGSKTFFSEEETSFFPELEMKQEMAVSLDGQVGDRMRVYLDHNSERFDESQNKITVTYMGREDDILQEIEGGDTDLSIPATNYTGDIPSHSGLFGIKSTAKIGPLDLVAIASNEQTQTQEIEIEGSIQSTQDTLWAKYYEKRRFFWLGTYGSILDVKIYVDDNNVLNNNLGGAVTYYGEAFLDTNDNNVPDDTSNPTNYKEGYFTEKLQGVSDFYLFIPGSNIIELNYGLPDNQVLGVYYKKVVGADTIEVGRLPTGTDTIQLKMICPEYPDTLSYTWKYEKKNYYQIVSPGSRLDSLRIYYVESGGENKETQNSVSYIQVLGLDVNQDGMIDENTVYYPSRGLLIFPDSMPFASSVLDDPDFEIYTNSYMNVPGKYYLYKKTMEAKPVFMLPENIVNVWVYVDDILQDSVHDYHVDYDAGRLEFKKPIPPTSKVRIKTEYAPFFSAAQKSLIGVRASLKPFGDATLGSSFFYRTESYPAEHVRLREEPFNRMVWEVDFLLPQSLPQVTRFVDWLPLVETESESNLNLNFEGAYSFSNLNSSGEVWLDDLESSTIKTNDIAIDQRSWVLSSMSVGQDTGNFVKQRLIWYNLQDNERLEAEDIYEDPLDPNEIADVLKIIFNPDSVPSFGGLMQYIYSEDFDATESMELIIKGKGGRIHIDIAQEIDEDQLRRDRNGVLVGLGSKQDEDQNPANGVWNEQNEDTGLDGVYGDDDQNVPGDDGNDDYTEKDYTGGINGTEGNRLWDTEDIDHNGILNGANRYYSYSLHFDSTQYQVENAGLKQDWKMFRIPIKDSTVWDTVLNQPDWHTIKYIRIWFNDFASTETLLVYRLGGTGGSWKNYGIKRDRLSPADSLEVFVITPVNTKTHSYYKSPYPSEVDPLTGEVKSEGGLELRLENIKEGHTCITHRKTDSYEDYRAYDTLSFYLNAHNSNPLISMRIGSDSLNYYEYTTEYENGLSQYNYYRLFAVSLKRFVDLKGTSQGDTTTDNSGYTVVGNPSLAVNQFLELRVKNQYTTPLTDTIWFNDVKLVSPEIEVGKILRGNGSINFADLASVSFSYNESNGRFKRLTESKDISTQGAGRSYSVGSSIALDKFFPETWGFNIPVGLNYHNSEQEPRYSYNASDLELDDAGRKKQRTKSIGKSYTLHISKSNSKNWFLKQTLDRLSFNHSRSNTCSRSALNTDTSQVINYGASYSLDPKVSFKVFNQTFSVLPQNVSFSASHADNLVKSYYRPDPDSAFQPSVFRAHRKTLDPSFSTSYSPHPIINTDFAFSQSRDSVSQKRKFGEEVGRHQSFNASLAQDLKIVSPRFSYNSSYDEDHRFEIRQDQDLRNVSNSARYGVNGSVNIQGIVKFFTGLRDETKDTLLTTGSPTWLAKQIETFIEYIQNPTLNYSRYRYSSYLSVTTRPDIKYQWGFLDAVPSEDVTEGSLPGRGMTDTYGFASGIGYKTASLTGGYSGNINRIFNYDGSETRTENSSYPSANLRISRLEAMPFLKEVSRSSSVSSSFNQSFEKRYDIKLDTMELISDSKSISFSPLISWQTTWLKNISTTVNINYSKTNSTSYGVTEIPSMSSGRGGDLSVAYTFTAPHGLRIPLLGGLKLSSNLTANFGINYNQNTSYVISELTNDSRTLGADIGISYNFSSSITGGANFDYTQNKEIVSDQNSKRVGLNIWTNINF